jgi:hypothetical protein
MATFSLDTSDATRLMEELDRNKAQLVSDVKRITLAAGRSMMAQTRAAAPNGPYTKGFRNSINTRTKQFVSGIEVNVESKSAFGTILEYVAGINMFGQAADAGIPTWQQDIADAVGRVL